MSKRRPKSRITLPQPDWDKGADGPANRLNLKAVEIMQTDHKTGTETPTGEKHMRRVDMLDRWHSKGQISAAGYVAAKALRDAWEATKRAPGTDYARPRVDSSPKPDHSVTIQIDRISRFHSLNRLVADQDRHLIDKCVLQGGIPASLPQYRGRAHTAGIAHLAEALDRLAETFTRSVRTGH